MISVKVRVDQDNTRREVDNVRRATELGIALAVPAIVALAKANVSGYSSRIAGGLVAQQAGPATWLIIGTHHASHIAESGARHAAAHPFLLPALMASRGAIVAAIQNATP